MAYGHRQQFTCPAPGPINSLGLLRNSKMGQKLVEYVSFQQYNWSASFLTYAKSFTCTCHLHQGTYKKISKVVEGPDQRKPTKIMAPCHRQQFTCPAPGPTKLGLLQNYRMEPKSIKNVHLQQYNWSAQDLTHFKDMMGFYVLKTCLPPASGDRKLSKLLQGPDQRKPTKLMAPAIGSSLHVLLQDQSTWDCCKTTG